MRSRNCDLCTDPLDSKTEMVFESSSGEVFAYCDTCYWSELERWDDEGIEELWPEEDFDKN